MGKWVVVHYREKEKEFRKNARVARLKYKINLRKNKTKQKNTVIPVRHGAASGR